MVSAIVLSDPLNPRVRVPTLPEGNAQPYTGNMQADTVGHAGPVSPRIAGSAVDKESGPHSERIRFDSQCCSIFASEKDFGGTSGGPLKGVEIPLFLKYQVPQMTPFGTCEDFGFWNLTGISTLGPFWYFGFC